MQLHNKNVTVLWLGSLFTGVFLGIFIVTVIPAEHWFHFRHVMMNYFTGDNVIFLNKQPVSSEYIVPFARLKEPGYITLVYADVFDTPGVEGDLLGESRSLAPGSYRNEIVSVSQVIPGREFFICLQAGTKEHKYGTIMDSTYTVVCERGHVK